MTAKTTDTDDRQRQTKKRHHVNYVRNTRN